MANILLFSNLVFTNIWNTMLLTIDSLVYWFCSMSYQVFYLVSRVNMFGDADLKVITNRLYTVLGIAMLFIFTYNIILMLANPDDLSKSDDKSFQGLAKNLIISIIMLTLLPTFFNYLQVLQMNILGSGVLENIILGGYSSSSGFTVKSAGQNTSLTIFEAFYHPIVTYTDDTGVKAKREVDAETCIKGLANNPDEFASGSICDSYIKAIKSAQSKGNISVFIQDNTLKNTIGKQMSYRPLMSTIAGCYAAYLFLSFAIDCGIRMAKLGFLQVIAPVPVVLRIFKPTGGTFSRWIDKLVKTYLEVFIRLLVVYFSMYTISLVPEILATTVKSVNDGSTGMVLRLLANIILILGILKFAKDGPKMAEELFAMEHVETSIKKKLDDNEYAKRAAGFIGAGVGSLGSNSINAFKGIKDAHGGRAKFGATVRGLRNVVGGGVGGAVRGWQHGNTDTWGHLGQGVSQARADNNAALNRMDPYFLTSGHAKEAWEGMGKNALGGLKTFVTGEGLSNAKLEAAKQASAAFDRLFKPAESDVNRFNEAQKQALKDLDLGKPVSVAGYSYTKDDGHTVNVPPETLTTDAAIKTYFETRRRLAIGSKFNSDTFRDTIRSQGQELCDQLTTTLGTLGPDSAKDIFKDTGISDVNGLKSIFETLQNGGTISNAQMISIRKIADKVGDQVKVQQLQVEQEKAKEKK